MSILSASSLVTRDAAASIRVKPLTPGIGAEILDVDLSRGVDDVLFAALHRAFLDYQVIFFRDQDLTTEQHRDLALRFGTPALSKKLKTYDGYEDVSLLENDGSKKAIGALWHADNTDYERPPLGSLLYAEIVPPVGGDTMWASMYAAYDALSASMKAYLEGLSALHDNSLVRKLYAADQSLRSEGIVVEKAVRHPVVRTHPETGRKLIFVNSGYTQAIAGVSDIESRSILQALFEHIAKPEFQVRFRWERGSMAIWDNRCTQHYALDDYVELRRMRRVQIDGDMPY
ncbi:MAG: TauD/TfdA dioxygenase family protein [Pseudomonadota bacterium]